MAKVLRVLFLALLVVCSGELCFAQRASCTDILNEARESYDAGHLYEIPARLKPCLDNGFNKSQKIQAYWLLTRTYLLIDDPISAEDSYLKLLRLDPEYNIDEENDPVDVVYLSKKFTTTPIFVVFGKIGTNFSNISEIHNFGTDNTEFTNEVYSSSVGINLGGGIEWNINDKLSLGLEIMYSTRSYSYTNSFFNNDQLNFKENITVASVPLYLKYRLKYNKFRPYVYGGFSNDLIVSSKGSLELRDKLSSNVGEEAAEFAVTGPDIDMSAQRNFYNYSAFAGLGTNYRIDYNYIFIDFRYALGFTNIVDIENQYANNELVYKYGYVDDYKRLNGFFVSVGFVKPLYKPRKKTKGNKGIFNKLFNKN